MVGVEEGPTDVIFPRLSGKTLNCRDGVVYICTISHRGRSVYDPSVLAINASFVGPRLYFFLLNVLHLASIFAVVYESTVY